MEPAFPYDAVIAEFRRVGKHFVSRGLLTTLDAVRRSADRRTTLARFLDVALDKYDERFDNPSYIALDLLPLEDTDRLLAMLVADTLRFETTMRPGARVTAKRCRLGERAIAPALQRLGLADQHAVLDSLSAAEARMLQMTMLPVSTVHDEVMFLRMLQCYETTFAFMARRLRAALDEPAQAAEAIDDAARAMREAAPLWSLVATMAPEAFLEFRQYTEGASAIQSRGYKTVESLCRRPEAERLDSPAYRSVPEVRERVLAGQPALSDALAGDRRAQAAMHRLETAIQKWRHSHYRLALKMLGPRPGTGYTEGVPYLERARSTRIFAPSTA